MAGRRLGIVIGTNEYSDSSIRNLHFAEKDATDIKNILLDPEICGFDGVLESINKTRTQTFCEIDQMLKSADIEDLILIYFSGHGEPDSQHDLCLLFKNTKMDSLIPTSLNYSLVRKCIDASSCKTVVVVLDCCYSGAASIKGNNLKEIISKSSGSGTVILSASSEFDVAKEDEKLENGVFTYYFIEGLKSGSVAGDNNGDINLDDLYNYVYENTIRHSQVPFKQVACEGKVLIGKNPLKVKEQDFKKKKSKLARIIRKELPTDVYNISMIVLVDAYEKPGELTETDIEINSSLEDLLEDKMSVKAYINTVQCYLENEEIEYSPVLVKFREQETPRVFKDQEIQKTFFSPSTEMEFVRIPAGSFSMGSPSDEEGRYDSESPIHKVTIKSPFYLGKYPVTQRQWVAVMGSNPSNFKGDNLPVESVLWDDVQEFIARLNEMEGTEKYRLPSEAEWEYACCAGTTTIYSFGNNESKLEDYCWYSGYSTYEEWNKNKDKVLTEDKTHPVGQKKSNPWGLYDMHGNVWEWIQDSWHGNYGGAPFDGNAWEDEGNIGRVIRGGGWDNDAKLCRSAYRNMLVIDFRDDSVGFRLLRKL